MSDPITWAEVAAKIRAAAERVSPAYHYDVVDGAIAAAFVALAEEFEESE